MGPSNYLDPLIAQPELTEDEILLRREFARLFVKTDNAYTACKGLGIAQPYIRDWAQKLLGCCVVHQLVYEERLYQQTEEALKDKKQEVLAKLMELANYAGPGSSHGARVTALVNYGKFIGMDQPTSTVSEVLHKGGVMMVPALTNPDAWGELAKQSQEALKTTVKD